MPDVRTWLLWALTVLVTASRVRNPLYSILTLLIAAVVELVCAPHRGAGLPSSFRFGVTVVVLGALFNGLTAHLGDTVLFSLPAQLPLSGGPVTLEALVYGATNGLVLAAIFSSFSTFNRVTPVRDLVRLTPRAFHEAGVVISIALTFIPQMMYHLDEIRDAQAVRGHRMRGLRDWLPVILPLLTGGLERAIGLAEAMVARGYGALSNRRHSLRTQMFLLVGLMGVLVGWLAFLLLPQWRLAAVSGMIASGGLIAGLLWQTGRSIPHTSYRMHRWTLCDSLIVLGCCVTLVSMFAPLPFVNRKALYYSPYPRLSPPPFDAVAGVGLFGLLVPAIVVKRGAADGRD
jgi:energy-coupling factor transport system permease protein